MKVAYLIVLTNFIFSSLIGQDVVVSKSILQELEFFDSFLEKFEPHSQNKVFVLKIDSGPSTFRAEERLYLLSSIHNSDVVPYINPKYGFYYKGNLYLIKTELEIEFRFSKIRPCSNDLVLEAQQHLKNESKELLGSDRAFPYCYFFVSYSNIVGGGKNIGSCDPYFFSGNEDGFFYNDKDIERINRTKLD